MTVEEARMILNLKAQEGEVVEEAKERLTKVSSARYRAEVEAAASRNRLTYTLVVPLSSQSYEHLFAVNAPPAPKGQKGGGSGSFYMQSKVVRARQRIEAEWEEQLQAVKEAAKPDAGADQSQTPPPPPPPAQ
jgi:import inner membrane translocase subunit TIM16